MSNCKTSLTNIGNIERDPVFLSQKAKPGGVATLDANGKVPLSQIDISAIFTERDPVYRADRGVPFGCATLDGFGHVPSSQLGSGVADSTTVLFGDGVYRTGGGGSTDDRWKLTGNVISEVTITNKVVVGSPTPLGKFSVVGDTAGDITAVIKGAPAQTADLLSILNSTGAQLVSIGATVFVDMADGSSAPVAPSAHGRFRYHNVASKAFQTSVDGGPWLDVIVDQREVERIASMLDL